MTNKLVALDTNVLIYLHDNSSPAKREIAKNLLSENPHIPSQVVSEYINTCRRLLNLSKEDLLIQTSGLLHGCSIIPVSSGTLLFAATLITKYKFQLFDAIIVAAALEGNCSILYSEDMQHNLTVEKTLTIINPFI
jgi:predicted nucleic acid-binding protein